jgi:hypothetical protein
MKTLKEFYDNYLDKEGYLNISVVNFEAELTELLNSLVPEEEELPVSDCSCKNFDRCYKCSGLQKERNEIAIKNKWKREIKSKISSLINN